MIQVESSRQLEEMEAAVSRAAQKHGAHVLSAIPFASLLSAEARRTAHDAIVFSVCHTGLYAALLAADVRFAAFLPCRIAAVRLGDSVRLEAMSPKHFSEYLSRPDLDHLVTPLEALLRDIMEEAAHAAAAQPHAARPADAQLGAHEEQMSMRAPIPPRIDRRGTKVEELAGTGKIDAPGG
jgi:uncharacterized protein (DUF302 family)